MKSVIRSAVALLALSFVVSPGLAHAKKLRLTGSQKAGSLGHQPVIKSPAIVLTAPTTIVKVDRNADSYSIWKDGKVYFTIQKDMKLSGMLPAGRYILRSSIGSVTIYLDTAAKPKVLSLWAKQKRGPNHWFKGNVVVLGKPYLISASSYNGTDGVGIFPKGSHQFVYRFISSHNMKEKGPAVLGAKGKLSTKTLIGLKLGPGAFVVVPGIGTADNFVETEIKLKPF